VSFEYLPIEPEGLRWLHQVQCGTAHQAESAVNPAASVHWLRHAHACHAIDNGAPITLVSATLGHADLKTTSVYAHARPGESSGRYLKTK
jgi:site-specific recombinase XerD